MPLYSGLPFVSFQHLQSSDPPRSLSCSEIPWHCASRCWGPSVLRILQTFKSLPHVAIHNRFPACPQAPSPEVTPGGEVLPGSDWQVTAPSETVSGRIGGPTPTAAAAPAPQPLLAVGDATDAEVPADFAAAGGGQTGGKQTRQPAAEVRDSGAGQPAAQQAAPPPASGREQIQGQAALLPPPESEQSASSVPTASAPPSGDGQHTGQPQSQPSAPQQGSDSAQSGTDASAATASAGAPPPPSSDFQGPKSLRVETEPGGPQILVPGGALLPGQSLPAPVGGSTDIITDGGGPAELDPDLDYQTPPPPPSPKADAQSGWRYVVPAFWLKLGTAAALLLFVRT